MSVWTVWTGAFQAHGKANPYNVTLDTPVTVVTSRELQNQNQAAKQNQNLAAVWGLNGDLVVNNDHLKSLHVVMAWHAVSSRNRQDV